MVGIAIDNGIINNINEKMLDYFPKYDNSGLDPLGITIEDWKQSPQGIYFSSNNMFFTTRDMAVLGYLYLNGGEIINDVQIVPRDWVEESLTNRMPQQQQGWNWGDLHDGGYGWYLWWLGEIEGYKVFLAIGHGGQFLVNFPELNMVIAINSNAYVSWDTPTITKD